MTTSPAPGHRDALLSERARLTVLLGAGSYDLVIYLDRATVHRRLAYPDLAAGDAYRALLLIDEALDESAEFHDQVLDALRRRGIDDQDGTPDGVGAITKKLLDGSLNAQNVEEEGVDGGAEDEEGAAADSDALAALARGHGLKCYQLLAESLLETGCLRSAYDFCNRGLQAFPGDQTLLDMQHRITHKAHAEYGLDKPLDPSSLPAQGYARREIYPWNTREPDRFSKASLHSLNRTLATVAPKCCVQATELPQLHGPGSELGEKALTVLQLGLFATEDIAPGEVFLREKSLLTASNRLHSATCDACSSTLPQRAGGATTVVECRDCYDVVFCSQSCLDFALSSYHPALCGNDSMTSVGRDVPRAEAADSLYLLLLVRAMAMAETQDTHPLELDETRFIWGDFVPGPVEGEKPAVASLPFDFRYSVELPLNILLQLDLDPFSPEVIEKYDTWVINTLYSKFRGVASAKFDPEQPLEGPVVCAVHPLWCLANHSCDPNVGWAWGGGHHGNQAAVEQEGDEKTGDGGIIFWARKMNDRASWDGRKRAGGLRKGQEIFSHYCDLELPVKERREWAQGALGGDCVCERCVWEAAQS